MDVNEWLRKLLEETEPDLLREMVRTFAETLMSADADEDVNESRLHWARISLFPDRDAIVGFAP